MLPGATIRGTYATYEDSSQRSLVEALGHVVELNLERIVRVEMGGWGTKLKLITAKDVKVELVPQPNGQTKIYLSNES